MLAKYIKIYITNRVIYLDNMHLAMNTLLIATTNPGKIRMYQNMFLMSGLDESIDFKFLSDFPNAPESPEENGDSPKANALIKAKYYANKLGLATLADDAGFSIDALGGKPGVMARRWAGELPDTISDEDWITFYLDQVKDLPAAPDAPTTQWGDLIKGSFPFARCLYLPNGMAYYQEEKIDCFFSKTPRRPYKAGWPLSSMRILLDGRHEMDVPDTDPTWE